MCAQLVRVLARFAPALVIVMALLAVVPIRASSELDAIAPADWPQLGRDPQRSSASPQQVEPPYCFAWKWYEVPFASRAQPVVAGGRLFIGGMDGLLYARDATTGAPLWSFATGGPIRHTAAVSGSLVFTGSHDGATYALDAATGSLRWRVVTGPSATAPLVDPALGRVYVASADGTLIALRATDGLRLWQYQAPAPLHTSPSLSVDGQTVFAGDESLGAFAVRASDGALLWRTTLQGQSLAERYPVVAGEDVYYRSQPIDYFHNLLQDNGDAVMDEAGARLSDWAADWAVVKPKIISHLTATPHQQTFFALRAADGISRGVAPVLYTYGNNDIPAPPVVRGTTLYLPYRARHGLQTDSPSAVHVTTRYDAELGALNPASLDIAGVRSNTAFSYQFRLTSDEPAMLTLGGSILWVDNWERVGGVNLDTGAIVYGAHVSNDWPECFSQCGPAAANPFFPLQAGQAAYPFPSPRVGEGHARGGAVIGNAMVYWRVIEGGIGALAHQSGASCPTPKIWAAPAAARAQTTAAPVVQVPIAPSATQPLTNYVTVDLTAPALYPPAALVKRLRAEVTALVDSDGHLVPFYLQRGFSAQTMWPAQAVAGQNGPPEGSYRGSGNLYWHDPGELLYTLALAYPYLEPSLQVRVRSYVAAELERYPILENLPYGDAGRDWLRTGVVREPYTVPFRAQLNIWPPPGVTLQSLYGLWLWSKQTGDWSYAEARWPAIKALFTERSTTLGAFYADLGGAIAYVRLAQHFGDSVAVQEGTSAAVAAMEAGRDFQARAAYAANLYRDPRGEPTGWSMPVLYGLTPEVGSYLRDQTSGAAARYIVSKEQGEGALPVGVRWWYLTRAGAHGEVGETSYLAPVTAWSHFLAQAYINGQSRATLERWLDRPWGRGDLYSIQKIVVTIQAPAPAPTPPTAWLPLVAR